MAFGKTGIDWRSTLAAVWRSNRHFLKPVTQVDLVSPDSLLGMEEQKALLYRNTENFLRAKPASHALLWGAQGVGKSSLIKTLLTRYHSYGLRLIQLPRENLDLLLDIMDEVHDHSQYFIVFCDDIGFRQDAAEYRVLKSALEGTLEKPPANVLIYATSNRLNLMPEYMADNVNIAEYSLPDQPTRELDDCQLMADRFGLSLAFPLMERTTYLALVDRLFQGKNVSQDMLHEEALKFAQRRNGLSGRTARHFFNHYQMYL